VKQILKDIAISDKLFNACYNAAPRMSIQEPDKSGYNCNAVQKAHARQSQISDIFLKLLRRVVMSIQRRVFKYIPKGRFASGGAIVAIIGGDGAGKSTAIDDLCRWLSPDIEIHKIHMGKPAWSWMTIFLRGLLKLGRSVGLYPFIRAPEQYKIDV
jgi:ABC-type multidrug transport system fused ATPase/permease subunit